MFRHMVTLFILLMAFFPGNISYGQSLSLEREIPHKISQSYDSPVEKKEDVSQGIIPDKPFVDLVIVGIGEGTLSSVNKDGTYIPDENVGFNEGLTGLGRVSLYIRGKVANQYGITISYDSDDPFRDRLFENLDTQKFYAIYGDSSNYYRDGQSKNRLYVKVDVDKSYLMYGDFSSGFVENELTYYNRTFPGLKAHYETENMNFTAFGTGVSQELKEDSFPGKGLSGYFFLTGPEIMEGSEKIYIETRDKDISELVISSQVKMRNKDYTIDYEHGSILFKEPVPALDENGNPLYVIAQYECKTNNPVTNVGFKGDIKFSPDFSAGMTYINENSAPDVQLLGIHSNLKVNDKINFHGEYAWSHSLYGNGTATNIDLSTNLSPQFGINGFYRERGENYFNPSCRLIDRGIKQYGLEIKSSFLTDNFLSLAGYSSENSIKQTDNTKVKLNYKRNLGDFQLNCGYTYNDFTSPDYSLNSHLMNMGLEAYINSRLSLFAQEEVEWFKENGDNNRKVSSTTGIGANYLFDNGVTGYLREDFIRGDDFNGSNTILGFRAPIGENSDFYAQYALDGAVSGHKNQSGIGLNTRVNLAEGINVRFNYQHCMGYRKIEPLDSFASALEFLGNDRFKGSLRYEIKTGKTDREKLISFYGDGKISEDLSIIGRFTYSDLKDFSSNDFRRIDSYITIGLAYRPLWNDSLNLLARYDIRRYRNTKDTSDLTDNLTYIASVEAVYSISDTLQMYGKYAYKEENDRLFNSIDRISLIQGRLTYNINDRFSIYGEARYLNHIDEHETSLSSTLALDYLLWQNFMIEGGYIFKKYEEFSLFNDRVTYQGPYIKLLLKN